MNLPYCELKILKCLCSYLYNYIIMFSSEAKILHLVLYFIVMIIVTLKVYKETTRDRAY